MNAKRRRAAGLLAGISAQVAGVVWILQWAHSLVTHGPTQYDLTRTWLGMTWFDSGKFLALPFLLLIPAVVFVVRRSRLRGRGVGRTLAAVTIGALVASAVGTAMQFWSYEWGMYRSALPAVSHLGGPIQAVSSSMLLTVAFVLVGVRSVRAGAMPLWLVLVIVVGSLSTVFLAGPLPPIAGLAWLVLGGWVLTCAYEPMSPDEWPSLPAEPKPRSVST